MTKFEQVGINYLQNANGKDAINRTFKYSCECCCNKGMHIDCDRCAIAHVHSMLIAITEDQNRKGNHYGKKL